MTNKEILAKYGILLDDPDNKLKDIFVVREYRNEGTWIFIKDNEDTGKHYQMAVNGMVTSVDGIKLLFHRNTNKVYEMTFRSDCEVGGMSDMIVYIPPYDDGEFFARIVPCTIKGMYPKLYEEEAMEIIVGITSSYKGVGLIKVEDTL